MELEKKFTYFFKSIAVFTAVLFLFSCENDVNEVKNIAAEEERIPLEVHENLKLEYSDSSIVKLELTAPVSENYPQLEEPERLFPEGLTVRFFDFKGKENSRLKANWAKQLPNQYLWHAKGDVVVVNKEGQQLNTEELFWDEKKEIIYSHIFVKITNDEKIIMGEGFEAPQDFETFQLAKVTGELYINDDEESN